MDLKKAEKYLNRELGFVKNTLISYPEVIKAMAKYAESEAINYSRCCKSDRYQLPDMTLEEAIAKAKPNLDKIKDVDKHIDDIR